MRTHSGKHFDDGSPALNVYGASSGRRRDPRATTAKHFQSGDTHLKRVNHSS